MSWKNINKSEELADRCNQDGEFAIAARYWNGGFRMEIGERAFDIRMVKGVASSKPQAGSQGVITLKAPIDLWEKLLSAVPPRFHNDVYPLTALGMTIDGDPLVLSQYYSAIIRALELLRSDNPDARDQVTESGVTPRHDTPVGRYIHLVLEDDQEYRIYYEEAGQGIPLLLHHTAGCHGSQWRHLFEVPEIINRFRLVAYDMPYHGKSMPPVEKKWWAEAYRPSGEFLRSVPVAILKALSLKNPVFMGCSVGGALALDLAYHHPELFRSVISLEGTLKVGSAGEDMWEYAWSPQVSNDFKARVMNGAMSPTSPAPYRWETMHGYAAGWPPLFIGDLYYYNKVYDLTQVAHEIDTNEVGVHILSGEYDYSATREMGKMAHEAIKGSTFVEMERLGHFPMSEDPERFLQYLMPILEGILENGR